MYPFVMKHALPALLLSLTLPLSVLAHEPIPALNPKGDVYKTEGPNDDSIYGTTIGDKNMLMVYTCFPDLAQPGETTQKIADRMLGDGRFLDIFHKQSYGKLTLTIEHIHGWREMPRPQKENDPTTTEGHRQMFIDIFALYPETNFHDYDYLVAKLPGRGNYAFGERKDQAIPYRDGFIFHAVNIGSNNPGVLAHEVAHCMGLPDIYTYGDLQPKNPAGAWDIMSSGGGAAGFLGWHRHKLGWMDRSSKVFLTEGSHEIELNPLSMNDGVMMIVVPIDDPKEPSAVFVAEIGQPPHSQKGEESWPAGVLIYRVDATKPTGQNPVVVFPREDLKAGATFTEGHLFEHKDAPLRLEVGAPMPGGGHQVNVTVAALDPEIQ